MSNDQKPHILKWKAELIRKGVEFPEDINDEDLKTLVFANRKDGEKAPIIASPQANRIVDNHRLESREEAEVNVKAIVDAQMADMRKQMAEMKQLLAAKSAPASADNTELVDALVKAMDKATTGRTTDMGLMNPDFIPADDLLETPETFFAPSGTFYIWGKRIGNVFTPVPLGMKFIRFEKAYGWMERNPNGNQQKIVATFICWSKTLSEFLMGLPEYGVQFHKSFTSALASTREGDMISMYSKHFGGLSTKNLGELTTLATMNNIPVSVMYSLDDYRKALAEKWALEEMASQNINFNAGIQEVFKKDLLTGAAAHA